MQVQKALKLQKLWGDKPCSHPSTEKEYFNGSDTGDHVCTTCGKAVIDANGNKIGPEKVSK